MMPDTLAAQLRVGVPQRGNHVHCDDVRIMNRRIVILKEWCGAGYTHTLKINQENVYQYLKWYRKETIC